MQSFAKRIRACRGYRFSPADTVGGLRRHAQRGVLRMGHHRVGALPTARIASAKEVGCCERWAKPCRYLKFKKIIFDKI